MCRLGSNKSSLARLQNAEGKHPSGNQDSAPRWCWKNALHPSPLWIIYFSPPPSSPFGEERTGTRLSCHSSDLCLICKDVFMEPLLSRIHYSPLPNCDCFPPSAVCLDQREQAEMLRYVNFFFIYVQITLSRRRGKNIKLQSVMCDKAPQWAT